ncbi:MAG: sulfate adenylyltransferase subunit CysD [Gammaproteobacteria bacterium]|nr:MAG: sulfate adenylyltransferase subunit CysD [Gammaproteobacteria bacterium]
MTLPAELYKNRFDEHDVLQYWDTQSIHQVILKNIPKQTLRATERALESSGLIPQCLKLEDLKDENDRAPKKLVITSLEAQAKRKRYLSLVLQAHKDKKAGWVLFANDGRLGRRWLYLKSLDDHQALLQALQVLAGNKNLIVWPHGSVTANLRALVAAYGSHDIKLDSGNTLRIGTTAYQSTYNSADQRSSMPGSTQTLAVSDELSHLDRLEAESIHIMREVMAQAENPVMMYSVGKDSAVMLHLAQKAFYPAPPPFPLLHVDTRWKFQEMYQFRDEMVKSIGMELIVHTNPEGVEKNVNPFDHGSALHTDVMKTQGLKQALDKHKFDVAFGGARRDEEKSRAKERVFSFRTANHRWDPKNQRPELWDLYNSSKNKGESIRVFPLSNWTELDIWQYIYREQIPIVPLYFAAERPVVERDGMLIMVDDDRARLFDNEEIQIKRVRFRTLGCYPLTGAVESDADDLSSIILELLQSKTSERQGRAIDSDSSASMEKKKQEGYF